VGDDRVDDADVQHPERDVGGDLVRSSMVPNTIAKRDRGEDRLEEEQGLEVDA